MACPVQQRVVGLMKAYLTVHKREPNAVYISHDDEHELAGELPDKLKSEAFIKGVRAVGTGRARS
jgi:hypothetical protein